MVACHITDVKIKFFPVALDMPTTMSLKNKLTQILNTLTTVIFPSSVIKS